MYGKWSVSQGTTIASSIFILFLKSDIGMQILAEEINILKKKSPSLILAFNHDNDDDDPLPIKKDSLQTSSWWLEWILL